jgi:sulfide:quinone oxidoreductase
LGKPQIIPLRLAPFTGVYGISFAFMMMATALGLALLRRSRLELLWLLPLLFLVFLPEMPSALRGREAALLLHDDLVARGCRADTEISLVMPFGKPIPPSPETSDAILAAFAERGIRFVKERLVKALDPVRKVAVLDDGSEMPYGLFLGVPVHRVPKVVAESGLVDDAWVPVNKQTLATKFPGVYAVGDVNGVGTPKAGVFAEGAAKIVAAAIITQLRGGEAPGPYAGAGSCYIEFGSGRVGRVDVNFLGGPKPTGAYQAPTAALIAEKIHFGSSRIQRWFGREWSAKR